ncbi:hypothetical protein [Gilliamella sp. A7]|nr:hypothetical protein [Gilliamella sp. A7]
MNDFIINFGLVDELEMMFNNCRLFYFSWRDNRYGAFINNLLVTA